MAVISDESETPRNFQHCIITSIWSLIPLLGVKIMHLADRTGLFNISNLGWKEDCNESSSKHL
jgi:hypothetical protein